MPKIIPFKAIRPPRDKANLVASRPFYTYKKDILAAKLASNPYSFLHVISPHFGENNTETEANSNERFQLVRQQFDAFCKKAYFFQEETPAYYIYRQKTADHEYTGVIAGVSVQDYDKGNIRIHEHTLPEREEVFQEYLEVCGFNAEPVLLTHKPSEELNSLISGITSKRSEYEFTTTDHITHQLWVIQGLDLQEKIANSFEKMQTVYIADGHHRSASSCRVAHANNITSKAKNFFLTFFLPEDQLTIYPFNRYIKSLSISTEELLKSLSKDFTIEKKESGFSPNKPKEFGMNVRGEWYKLLLKTIEAKEAHSDNLDVSILSQYILDPILHITNLKEDKNIGFIDGKDAIDKMNQLIESKKAELGFTLFPVSIDELKNVADNHEIMPPKSTWIEPKLRSGLTIYSLYDN